MLYRSEEMEERAVLQTAAEMCAAARTAPKAHGKDTLRTVVLTGDEKEELASTMERIGEREMGDKAWTWYGRDAANVRAAGAVVLIGAEKECRGVPSAGTWRRISFRKAVPPQRFTIRAGPDRRSGSIR